MRPLLLVILGLVVGAMGATFALSALRQGTPFHLGVMAVMQHHMGVLRANVRANQCDAKGSLAHLSRMRENAGDVREAFPGMDAPFYGGGGQARRSARRRHLPCPWQLCGPDRRARPHRRGLPGLPPAVPMNAFARPSNH